MGATVSGAYIKDESSAGLSSTFSTSLIGSTSGSSTTGSGIAFTSGTSSTTGTSSAVSEGVSSIGLLRSS